MKVVRAGKHYNDLKSETARFFNDKPYELFTEDDSNGMRHIKLKVLKNIPEEWSALVGDCIHNLRASLDILTVSVIQRCDPKRASYDHVYFVIRESKAKFEKDLAGSIRGASDAVCKMFRSLKPYRGGEELLWHLHQLDIADKHKSIVPVVSAYTQGLKFDANALFPSFLANGKKLPELPTLYFRIGGLEYPLRDGTTLFTVPIKDDVGLTDNATFRFELAFGAEHGLEGQPVLEVLDKMGHLVDSIINRFEAELLK